MVGRMTPNPFAQLHGIALNAEGATAPEWVQLLPAGPSVEGIDGRRWTVTDPAAVVSASMARNQSLPIDFEHATHLKGGAGERADAVGWIEALEVRDGAIWGRVDWNPSGREAVASRAYRYLSPVFRHSATTGAIQRLASAGLTNVPNLPLQALNRADHEETATLDRTVLEALGLATTATAADAVVAIGALKSARDTALNSAAHPDPEKFVPKADHQLALNRIGAFEAADKTRADAEIVAAVDAAVAGGKIAPASKDYHLASCRAEGGLERFKAMVAAAPVIAAPSGADKKDGAAAGAAALSAEELAMCRAFDHTPADFAAQKAKG